MRRYTRVGVIDAPDGADVGLTGTVNKVYAYEGVQSHAVTSVTVGDPVANGYENKYTYDD